MIKIITDSGSDLNINYIKENDIQYVCLEVNIRGKFIRDDFGQTLQIQEFYKLLRNGELTSTSQVNSFNFEEIFEKNVLDGHEVIYIGISSALSGTFQSAVAARDSILEKYPNASIHLVDSKSVSLGQGLIVYNVVEMLKKGFSTEAILKWVNENCTKVIHSIVVDDLTYLKRGGRISSTVAVIGGILNIKPTIVIDSEGKAVPGVKIKGRKKAIKHIVDELKTKGVDLENQVIFIAHADCINDANTLKELIASEVKVKDIIINNVGTVIGSHAGPGTLGAAFIGSSR